MQTKSPNKSSEQAFGIVQLFFVLQKLLKLNPQSKIIHQYLLDEIVSERWVLLIHATVGVPESTKFIT